MEHIIITPASVQDVAIIQQLGKTTFFETFAGSNTEADMKKYLDENFTAEKLVAELSNIQTLFFIAWENDIPVGYLKVNSGAAQTELQDDAGLEIERIYVLVSYHGKKVGQQLYEKALETARLQNKLYLWLGVWEENRRAIHFYEKNGFVAFDKHIFKLGNDEQTDIMMKKIL